MLFCPHIFQSRCTTHTVLFTQHVSVTVTLSRLLHIQQHMHPVLPSFFSLFLTRSSGHHGQNDFNVSQKYQARKPIIASRTQNTSPMTQKESAVDPNTSFNMGILGIRRKLMTAMAGVKANSAYRNPPGIAMKILMG